MQVGDAQEGALMSTTVITQKSLPTDMAERLAKRHAAYREAVIRFGEGETMRVIETYMGGQPVKAKVARAERHPAFQLLPRNHQVAIHHRQDLDELAGFIRQLLSTLAVMHDLRPLGKNASYDAWGALLTNLRNIDRPAPGSTIIDRAKLDAARRARQLQRATDGPKGKSGNGAEKQGSGKTRNAKKRARRANGY